MASSPARLSSEQPGVSGRRFETRCIGPSVYRDALSMIAVASALRGRAWRMSFSSCASSENYAGRAAGARVWRGRGVDLARRKVSKQRHGNPAPSPQPRAKASCRRCSRGDSFAPPRPHERWGTSRSLCESSVPPLFVERRHR